MVGDDAATRRAIGGRVASHAAERAPDFADDRLIAGGADGEDAAPFPVLEEQHGGRARRRFATITR